MPAPVTPPTASESTTPGATRHAQLEQARQSYRLRAWADARALFWAADCEAPLESADLERWSWSAGLAGCDDEMLQINERLYQTYHAQRDCENAAKWAFWTGFRLLARNEPARGNGWLARAQRIVDDERGDWVVCGYLLLPTIRRHLMAKQLAEAELAARAAAALGERFHDLDLLTFARHFQAQIKLREGHVEAGLSLFDEAMLAVTAGELSPVVTGILYCIAISGCRSVYALGRAREWTHALTGWCDAQPQLVPFAGACLAYRAEIHQLKGEWGRALEEVRRACDVTSPLEQAATADALYQQAEIYRLRGEFEQAEQTYREASERGREPQPGWALLRVAQGRAASAATSMRRLVQSTHEPLERARLLPALIEIELALGLHEAAGASADELEQLALRHGLEVLHALAAEARGRVLLSEGAALAALAPLRQAFAIWQHVGAPYLMARLRVALASACRALGDDDGAELELDAARAVFERLGAAPDLSCVDAAREQKRAGLHGLTARELQVLRLVASGKTNKVIARELFLSGKTIDRHLSNIFLKLKVGSRSAATAYAYEHALVAVVAHDG